MAVIGCLQFGDLGGGAAMLGIEADDFGAEIRVERAELHRIAPLLRLQISNLHASPAADSLQRHVPVK